MSNTIKEFLVGLGFEVDEAELRSFTKGIKAATVVAAAVGTAAIAASAALTKFVTGVAREFDSVSDLGLRVNATADEIMRLGYEASLTDSSVDAVASSLDGMNRVIGEAVMGAGEGVLIFQRLGISLRNSDGGLKSTAALMREVGDRIKNLSGAQQVAILGKLGIDPKMARTLTSDVSALGDEFGKLYSDLGIDADKAAQASSDFIDSTTRLTAVFDAMQKAVGLRFMTQIKGGIDQTRKQLVENMPKIVNAISPIISTVLRIAEAFATIVGRVAEFAGALIRGFGRINDATDGWAGYILAAAAAWKLLNLSFLASPVGIVLALAAAIAALVDDFLTWKEGGDSLIDWAAWETPIQAAIDIIGLLGDTVVNVFGFVMDLAKSLASLLTGDVSGAWDSLGDAGQRVVDQFGIVLDVLEQVGKVVVWLADKLGMTEAWDAFAAVVDNVARGLATVAGFASGAFGTVKGWFGGETPPLSPSPQAAATMTGAGQNVQQSTEIIVQGSADPQATARAVAGQQNRVNADMARNMRGAAR